MFVTHLTHADYVGCLTHGALYGRAPAVGVEADFALGDDALDRAVDILDRVFDGYDVAGRVFVTPVEHRGLRSGFTGTGGAGQNNQAALAHGKLFEHLRQAEVVDGEDVGGDAAHYQADAALFMVGIHTETDTVLRLQGVVQLPLYREFGFLFVVEGGVNDLCGFVFSERFYRNRYQRAVDFE